MILKEVHHVEQKTGTDVLIPIKPELRQLLIKHDYSIPDINEQEIRSIEQ